MCTRAHTHTKYVQEHSEVKAIMNTCKVMKRFFIYGKDDYNIVKGLGWV